MNLFDNPVFLTQKRLVHRAGVMAAVCMAGLIGLSLVAGLVYSFAQPQVFAFTSPQAAGKLFYGWLVAVEALVLVIGGFSRISRALAEERKAGLWDSNRLTPLRPADLVLGYWFGSALREFYMAAVLAALGLAIVLPAGLPLSLWLGTQVLLLSTALFFGLLAMVAGLAFQQAHLGTLLFLVLLLLQLFALFQPRYLLANFILPVYALNHLFVPDGRWGHSPKFFDVSLPPVLFSLVFQGALGAFLWSAVKRKTAGPFEPLFRRRDALNLFAVILIAQHGLIWELWRGNFQARGLDADKGTLLPITQAEALLVGAIVLALAGSSPEQKRLAALRSRSVTLPQAFQRSTVGLALALAAITGMALLTQCLFSLAVSWKPVAVATGNALAFFVSFSLLLEFCQMRFHRRATGFFVLMLFILCALPFILAGVFSNAAVYRCSLLAPGILALFGGTRPDEYTPLLVIVGAQLVIALLIFIVWRNHWQRLLRSGNSPSTARS